MSTRRPLCSCAALLAVIFIILQISPLVHAYAGATRLRCTVEDPTKALISGAKLVLTGVNGSFTASGITDSQGEFFFNDVPPGTYKLVVDKDGFTQQTIESVILDLNEVRVLNISLQVGAIQEVVQVTGQRVSIVPQQSFLRGLVDPVRMKELPLNGRNFADLIYTQPGVSRDTSVIFGSGHVVNGARSSANNFLLDGSDDNDGHFPAVPALNISTSGVPVDALDEFSVINSNATADYGRSAGGTINVVTRPGSDKWHGDLWEFLRNDVLDSRSFFDAPGQKNPFHQNQFGGRLGGEFKKTNYAFSYEGFRQRQLVPLLAIVPTSDFLATITNPSWKAILQSVYPAPNQPVAPGAITGGFNTAFDNGRDQDAGFVRLDHSFGQSHRSSLTLAVVDGDGALAGNGIPGTQSKQVQRNWHGVVTDNWMVRPTLYNSFHIGVNRISLASFVENVPAAALQSGVARTAGPFAGQPFDGLLGSPNGFPTINTVAGTFSTLGGPFFLPQARAVNTFHVQDSVAWIKGKHQISAGVEIHRLQINQNNAENARPTMFIDDTSLAALQAGQILNQQQNFYVYNHTAMRGFRNWEINFFAEDSYRIFSRLTLDYGLRYELNLPTTAVNDVLSNAFVMQNGRPQPCQSLPYGAGMKNVALVIPSQFGIDAYCSDKNNFAPRVGFAWDVFGDSKTVVRGSYGVFFDRIYGEALHQFSLNAPFAITTSIGGFAFDGTQASSALNSTSVLTATTVDPRQHTPLLQRWHLTVSRELTKNMLLNASYVGALGSNLTRNERPNFGDVFPDEFRPSNGISAALMPRNAGDLSNNIIAGPFGAIQNLKTDAISNYHALQFELLKRYSSGLTLQASYTWSHSLDTSSSNLDPTTTLNNTLAPLFAPGSSCAGAAGNSLSSASLTSAVGCATGNNALTTDQAAAIFLNQYISAAGPRADYGDSTFDVRHRFTANTVYELPLGRNKLFFHGVSGIKDKLISGWQVATIMEAQTGAPWPVLAGVDANFDGDNNDRAIATGNLSGLKFGKGGVSVDPNGAARQYQCPTFDPVAGACASPVGQGLGVVDPRLRLGRGALRAPGLFNMDASISKRISMGERYSLQFRSEFFNLLNRVNFAAPAQAINDPAFGTTFNQLLINNTQSRQIQFGLKLEF